MTGNCEACGKPVWPCGNADHRHEDTPFMRMCHCPQLVTNIISPEDNNPLTHAMKQKVLIAELRDEIKVMRAALKRARKETE